MDLNKIIRSLDLAKSDARDKTIEGIIEYIFFCIHEEVTISELNTLIETEFLLSLHNSELQEGITKVIDNNSIKKEGTKYSLTSERYIELRKIDNENSTDKQRRLSEFSVNIKRYSKKTLNQEDVNILWINLTEYIYECYLEHGKNALNIFSGKRSYADNDIDLNIVLNRYISKIPNTDLRVIFKNYIDNFANEVDSDTLEYLLNLANKAEAFFALGLSKDEYNHIYSDIKFDWTIFVDTNFLYSVLDLHSHPESEASKAVVEIGKQLKIKFQYLNITLQELQTKSKDFELSIPTNLLYSEIKALVNSNQLDNFSLRYFEKKLEDMDNTPHPVDVVGHAINNLKSKGIEIFRYPFDKLSSQEEFLKDQESKYNDYLKHLDENRAEKGMKIKGPKDARQIYHDIFLREAIVFLRDSSITSITDIKYLAATLDKRLIKYDNYLTMKKKDGVNIPVFFSPSVLLKKLLKYSPVKSDDYRRAFIKTISTPALENNYHTSKVTIRSVKYFHNMGISDEKLILNAIKDEIFLTRFKDLENNSEQLKEFVESEIQRRFVEVSSKVDAMSIELEDNRRLLTEISKEHELTNKKARKLEEDNNFLENKVSAYTKTLTGIASIDHKVPHYNPQLTIQDQLRLDHASKYLEEVTKGNKNLFHSLDDFEKSEKYHSWKKRSLWYLIPIVIITIHILLVLFWQNESWNYISSLANWFEKLTDGRKDVVKWIVGIIMVFCLYKPVKIINKRYSKSGRRVFLQNLNDS